jgi:tubulin monoglycylase TTLL3/8
MNDIIIKTFQACQDQIEHRPNCYEIYGMDFLLDHSLTPWLLEVNLSPACAERTGWLTELLDNMTEGLLDAIEAKMLRIHEDFDPELLKRMRENACGSKNKDRNQKWELVYDQRTS